MDEESRPELTASLFNEDSSDDFVRDPVGRSVTDADTIFEDSMDDLYPEIEPYVLYLTLHSLRRLSEASLQEFLGMVIDELIPRITSYVEEILNIKDFPQNNHQKKGRKNFRDTKRSSITERSGKV